MRKQHAKVKAKHVSMMCVIAAILCGILGVIVLNDATALIAALIFAPVVLCSKHIYW